MFTVLARLFKPAMHKPRKDAPAPAIETMAESMTDGSRTQAGTETQLARLLDNSLETKKDQVKVEMVDLLTIPEEPKSERQVQADTKATSAEEKFRLMMETTVEEEGKEDKDKEKEKATALDVLFNQQEKEINPLRGLIDSLVDVPARELVEQARGIEAMILEKETLGRRRGKLS